MTRLAKRDSETPDPGAILKLKGLPDLVVRAEAQKQCWKLLERASQAFHVGMKAWIISASLLKKIRDEQLHHHLGFSDFKTFLEKRFDGGRSTAFEYMKIAAAFPIPQLVMDESTMVDSNLPELFELDWHKLSALARLPEKMRDSLHREGFFTFGDKVSQIVNIENLKVMSRDAVQSLVAGILQKMLGPGGGFSASDAKLDEGQIVENLVKNFEDNFYSQGTLPVLEEMTELAPKLDSRARRSIADQIKDIGNVIVQYASAIQAGEKFSILSTEEK